MATPLRAGVLLAPFVGILLVFFAGWTGLAPSLAAAVESARLGVMGALSWGFAGAVIAVIFLIILSYFTLSDIRIGGSDAQPAFGTFAAVAVGVAASTSLGLLFWASAEPIYHVHQPPRSLGIKPITEDAQLFARAATYLHWSVAAHALNALFMIAFAIVTQNLGRRPSLDEVILGSPGEGVPPRPSGAVIDGIAVFFVTFLVAGGLASCILALSGEMSRFGPFAPNAAALFALSIAIVFVIFVAGAKPIRTLYATLARLSLILMLLLMAAVTVAGPTDDILVDGAHAVWQAILAIPKLLTFTGHGSGDPWPQTWTMTHWAGWMMLAPVVGLFLSRAARGFTIGEAIVLFAVVPGLISILWVAVFGGLAISADEETRGGIWAVIQRGGADDAVYAALWSLNGGEAMVVGFVALVVFAFASFAAGILHAVMRISVPEDERFPAVTEARRKTALIWCGGLALAGWGLASVGGGPVVEAFARIGGLPALLITLAVTFVVLRFCLRPISATAAPGRDPVQIDLDLGEDLIPAAKRRRRGALDELDDEPLPTRRRRRKSA